MTSYLKDYYVALPCSKAAETELTFSKFADVSTFCRGNIFLLMKITIKMSRTTDMKLKMIPETNKN